MAGHRVGWLLAVFFAAPATALPAPLLHQMARLIHTYYSYRNIQDLNIYTCNQSDASHLMNIFVHEDYKIKIKSSYSNTIHKPSITEGNFIDLSCQQNQDEFNRGERKGWGELWLIWGGSKEGFCLDSDVVLAEVDGQLWDLAETFQPAGSWDRPALPDRRQRFNLNGRTLRSVILTLQVKYDREHKEEQLADNFYEPYKEISQRFHFTIFSALAQYYNFRMGLVESNTWGLREANGSFTGMTGLIWRREADLGLAACEMREERFAVVTFLPFLEDIRFIYLFLEEPVLGTYKAQIIPFSSSVWLCMGVMVLLSGILFGVMYHGDLPNGFLLIIGVISQQGLSVEAQRASLQLLCACLLILGLLLNTYYNASIMNGLLSPAPTSIHNTEQLKKSPLRIGIANIPTLNFAYNQKRYIPADMLSKIQSRGGWLVEVGEGVELIRRGRFCLTTDASTLYPLLEEWLLDSEKCKIREMLVHRPFPLAVPLSKDTPYKEMFTQGVLRIQENGIAHREKEVWYPKKPHCLGSTIFTYVSLEAVSVAMMCLAFGTVASIIILTIELLYIKKANRK